MASTQGVASSPLDDYGQYLQTIQASIDLDRVDYWLHRCTDREKRHDICSTHNLVPEKLPKRLIDVGEADTWPCVPRLVESETLADQRPKYVALSHSWGPLSSADKGSMSTTLQNLGSRLEGLNMQLLPAKYQAVLILCRCLRLRYIWIDSLCIIQGEGGDWSAESMRMVQYYSFAFLTISINTDQNVLEAFSNPQIAAEAANVRRSWALLYSKYRSPESLHPFPSVLFWRDIFLGGPISGRAWCLQERHLSSRVLHLIDDAVVLYECEGTFGHNVPESFFDFVVNPRHAAALARGEARKTYWQKFTDLKDPDGYNYRSFWHSALSDFRSRILTVADDNLIALQGMAEIIQQKTGYTYLSGMWKEDLPRGLLWRRDKNAETCEQQRNWSRFSKQYQGPTWSWCSVTGPTKLGVERDEDGHELGTVVWAADGSTGEGAEETMIWPKDTLTEKSPSNISLLSIQNIHEVRDGGPMSPLKAESYLELNVFLKHVVHVHEPLPAGTRKRWIYGEQPDPGCLVCDIHDRGQPAIYGSVLFDIPSDCYSREIWCIVIAARPSMNTYMGLALEPIHQWRDQQHDQGSTSVGIYGHDPRTCDNVSHPASGAPGCFRRLGLALLTVEEIRDLEVGPGDPGEAQIHMEQLVTVGFERCQIRLY